MRTKNRTLKLNKFFKCCLVDYLNLFSCQLHPALFGKPFEQTADHLARTAEFVGQRLMRGAQGTGPGDEQSGKALIEFLEGNSGDQLHQVGEAVGKQMEDIIAERL